MLMGGKIHTVDFLYFFINLDRVFRGKAEKLFD